MEPLYARASLAMYPASEYDFTHEYLNRLKGVDYLPVRKRKNYHPRPNSIPERKSLTPQMRQMNKARLKAQVIKI